MKPKNRVFCIQCLRHKMLFESESKALNFINYNSDAVKGESGFAPVRAYYCSACGGWHVTHHKHDNDSIERKLNSIYDDVNNALGDLVNMIKNRDYDGVYKFGINIHFRIDGYKKLAEHLHSPSHIQTAVSLVNKLDDIIIDTFNTLYDTVVDFENNVSETADIKVYNWAISIGWSMLGFISKSDAIKEQLKERINDVKRRRDEYNKIVQEKSLMKSPEQRLVNRLEKYISNIDGFLENGQFEVASRHIHFAVVYIRKKTNSDNMNIVSQYIDKLLEYQKQIPEQYKWHPKTTNS